MADTLTTTTTVSTVPSGTVIATDDAGASGHVQIIKLARSADGSAVPITADADGIQVNLGTNNDVTVTGTVAVTQSGTWDEVGINDSGNSITVDAPVTAPVFVRLSDGSAAISALPVTDNGGNLSIDDGGNSITVDGTVAVSGTVAVTDNSGTLTVDAPVGTPVFVRLSDGSAAITALPVSLASVPSHAVTNAGTFVVQENGAALTALQTLDNIVSGSEAQVDIVAALPAGTNNIGDVDIASTPKSTTASAAAQVTQGTTAAEVLASNANRKAFSIQNTGATILKFRLHGSNDPTATVYHFSLPPGNAADDGLGGFYSDDLYTGAVRAVSSSAGGTMVITEYT